MTRILKVQRRRMKTVAAADCAAMVASATDQVYRARENYLSSVQQALAIFLACITASAAAFGAILAVDDPSKVQLVVYLVFGVMFAGIPVILSGYVRIKNRVSYDLYGSAQINAAIVRAAVFGRRAESHHWARIQWPLELERGQFLHRRQNRRMTVSAFRRVVALASIRLRRALRLVRWLVAGVDERKLSEAESSERLASLKARGFEALPTTNSLHAPDELEFIPCPTPPDELCVCRLRAHAAAECRRASLLSELVAIRRSTRVSLHHVYDSLFESLPAATLVSAVALAIWIGVSSWPVGGGQGSERSNRSRDTPASAPERAVGLDGLPPGRPFAPSAAARDVARLSLGRDHSPRALQRRGAPMVGVNDGECPKADDRRRPASFSSRRMTT